MKKLKLLCIVLLIITFAFSITGCDKAPEPRVKEGKFDFSVTIEVDGQVERIEGVFACNFVEAGRGIGGYYITWQEDIETQEVVDRLVEDCYYMVIKTCDDGTIYLDLNLHAVYFMGERSKEELDGSKPELYIEYTQQKAQELEVYSSYDAGVLESYGVKIIAYEYDQPIQNVFE